MKRLAEEEPSIVNCIADRLEQLLASKASTLSEDEEALLKIASGPHMPKDLPQNDEADLREHKDSQDPIIVVPHHQAGTQISKNGLSRRSWQAREHQQLCLSYRVIRKKMINQLIEGLRTQAAHLQLSEM